jgi:hypothetical protein
MARGAFRRPDRRPGILPRIGTTVFRLDVQHGISSISTVPSSLTAGALATRPERKCSVIAWTSSSVRSSSWAICRFDRSYGASDEV